MSKPIYLGYYRNSLNIEAIGFETSQNSWTVYLLTNTSSDFNKPLFTSHSIDEAYDLFYDWVEKSVNITK